MDDKTYLRNESCPVCGSSSGVGVFDNGDGTEFRWCYACDQKISFGANKSKKKRSPITVQINYPIVPLPARGLIKDVCQRYGIRTSGDSIYFPMVVHNKLTGYKVRDFGLPKEHPNHMRIIGQYQGFFGAHLIHTTRIVSVALGEFDAASVYQATGIPCISPPHGDASLVRTAKQAFDMLNSFDKIVVLPDKDKVNEWNTTRKQPSDYVQEFIELMGVDKVYVASLSFDDPNEYLQQGKQSLLKDAFWAASPQTGNLFHKTSRELIKPTLVGMLTGMPFIDELMQGLREHETTYIIGAPSKGKTTFIRNLLWNLSCRHIKSAAVILEGTVSSFVTSLSHTFYGGNIFAASEADIELVSSDIDTFIKFADVNGQSDIKRITTAIEAAVKVEDVKVVVVDNITAMSDPEKGHESATKLVKVFDNLAEKLNCHIVVVSHVTRGNYDDVPTLGSSALSSAIERQAMNVIGIWRESTDNTLKGRVLKCRVVGASAEKEFSAPFNERTQRYESHPEVISYA
jgi:archaellum biogenesis ATPase FlaH